MSILLNPYIIAPVEEGGNAFEDDFDDNSLDPAKWQADTWLGVDSTGTSYAETGGQLVMTPAANTAGNRYGALRAVPVLDFVNKTCEMDWVTYQDSGNDRSHGFEIVDTVDTEKRIRLIQPGVLSMQLTVRSRNNFGFGVTDLLNVSRDITKTKWRVINDHANQEWQFWSYISSWTLEFTGSYQNWVPSSCYLRLFWGTAASIPAAGVFTIDNLLTDAEF